MAHIYRWTIRTEDVRTRGMLHPGGKLEARRDSKALRAQAIAAFEAALARHYPCEATATATLEYTDARGYTVALAKYEGRPTERHRSSGAALGGVWTHADGTLTGVAQRVHGGSARGAL